MFCFCNIEDFEMMSLTKIAAAQVLRGKGPSLTYLFLVISFSHIIKHNRFLLNFILNNYSHVIISVGWLPVHIYEQIFNIRVLIVPIKHELEAEQERSMRKKVKVPIIVRSLFLIWSNYFQRPLQRAWLVILTKYIVIVGLTNFYAYHTICKCLFASAFFHWSGAKK